MFEAAQLEVLPPSFHRKTAESMGACFPTHKRLVRRALEWNRPSEATPVMTGDLQSMENKCTLLKDALIRMESVVIAFSGGVDSTLLLRVALDVLKDKVLAVTALSETTPRHEMDDALRLAKEFGANHLVIESDEMKLPEFVNNPEHRCYLCKKGRFSVMVELARSSGFAWVADGSNLDDDADYRPGMIAVHELGVKSPLLEAGLTKNEIRLLSKSLGLSTSNKPSYGCLATRIPYGSPITVEKLRQVDAAEELIRTMIAVNRQVRVRHCGDTARIEVGEEDLAALLERGARAWVVDAFKDLGFKFVTLDLEGYRMGSLNQGLSQLVIEQLEDGTEGESKTHRKG